MQIQGIKQGMGRKPSKEDTDRGQRMRALRLRLGLVGREVFPDDPVNSHARVSAIEAGRNRLTGSDALLAYARAANVSPEDIAAYRDGEIALDALLDRQQADTRPDALDAAFVRLSLAKPTRATEYAQALKELRKSSLPTDMTDAEAEALLKSWLSSDARDVAPSRATARR